MSPMQAVWMLGCFNGIAIGWFVGNTGWLRLLGVAVWVFTLMLYTLRYALLTCS